MKFKKKKTKTIVDGSLIALLSLYIKKVSHGFWFAVEKKNEKGLKATKEKSGEVEKS
jgi:hypothetical protein